MGYTGNYIHFVEAEIKAYKKTEENSIHKLINKPLSLF